MQLKTQQYMRIYFIPLLSIFFLLFLFIGIPLAMDSLLSNSDTSLNFISTNHKQIIDAVSSSSEVLAAILGIIITVVAIIVELAATRYSSRIIDLFIEDPVNSFILPFYVVTGIHSLVINHFAANGGLLSISEIINVLCLIFGYIVLIPYFKYILQFLKPQNVVFKIKENMQKKTEIMIKKNRQNDINKIKSEIFLAIEQISSICLNAISNQDTILAVRSIIILRDLSIDFYKYKKTINTAFFNVETDQAEALDFVTLNPEMKKRLSQKKILVESKILKQYGIILSYAIPKNRDLINTIAMSTRLIAEKAVKEKDEEVINLLIKYFNTYLRTAHNLEKINAAYNIAYQYKLFTNYLISSQYNQKVISIVNHFKYYGHLFYQHKMGFILETMVHDICDICIEAHEQNYPYLKDILRILLTIDRPQDKEKEDLSLRGVRKAQIKLAVYFLFHGNEEKALLIAGDMIDEDFNRINSICRELSNTKEEFWEIVDRGSNFDYIPESWKPFIKDYLKIFIELQKEM